VGYEKKPHPASPKGRGKERREKNGLVKVNPFLFQGHGLSLVIE